MIKNFPLGLDFGNTDTCVVMLGDGWYQKKRIPSVFAPGSWLDVENMAKSAGKNLGEYLQPDHFVLEYVDSKDRRVEKYMGQKVFDDRLDPMTTRSDQERYWRNNYSLEALMVGSAACTTEEIYGLYVVTGLPVHLYTQENARLIQGALLGTHTFTLNGTPRSMVVQSVKVITEGAGALIAYGDNESDEMQGVIDIGGETTDLYAAHSMRPYKSLIKGTRLGVGSVSDTMAEKFYQNYGRHLNSEVCSQLLRQHVNRLPYTQVRDRNQHYIDTGDLSDLIENAIAEIGQQIATFISQSWRENVYDMSRMLLVGGGAHYFKKYILERFGNARIVPNPEMANASGYASLVQAILEQDTLKQRDYA